MVQIVVNYHIHNQKNISCLLNTFHLNVLLYFMAFLLLSNSPYNPEVFLWDHNALENTILQCNTGYR